MITKEEKLIESMVQKLMNVFTTKTLYLADELGVSPETAGSILLTEFHRRLKRA